MLSGWIVEGAKKNALNVQFGIFSQFAIELYKVEIEKFI